MAAKYVCPACDFNQALLDKDVGKRAKCPKCGSIGQVISVTVSAPPSAPGPQAKIIHEHKAADPPSLQTGIRVARESVQPQSRTPPPAPPRNWHYSREDERIGPISEGELRRLIRDGEVRSWDEIWTEGMKEWAPADEYFEFDDEPRPRRRKRRRRANTSGDPGFVCGVLACVFGGIAFIFCPLLLGLAGIVLGIISVCISKDKTIGIVGLVISVAGLIIGMILGVIVWSSLRHF